MSEASRALNSIGESCANASFFGRTSSPIREKTRVAHWSSAQPPQYNRVRACIRVPARSKIKMGSSYPSKGIFIRKLRELTCKLKLHVRAKKRKYYFVWCCMKCFATIISPKKTNNKKIIIIYYFSISYPGHRLYFSDVYWSICFVYWLHKIYYIIEFRKKDLFRLRIYLGSDIYFHKFCKISRETHIVII